jgi:hypothetical protein
VLKGKGIEKILSIDFGDNSIQDNFLTKYKGDRFIKEALLNRKATNISKIVETEQLFAFQFAFEKMKFQIVYNKNNKNYLNGISLNFMFFPSEIHSNYEDYLISSLSAEYIEELLIVKDEDANAWNQIIHSAHPAIKEIFLNSKRGLTDDYIFIYKLHI